MMYRRAIFLSFIVGLVACSGGSSSGAASSYSLEQFCADTCGWAANCGSAVETQTCAKTCLNDNASVQGKLRGAFLEHAARCLVKLECGQADQAARKSCVDTAHESLAPSAVGRSFCDSMQNAAQKCSGSYNVASCVELTKRYTDSTLQAAQSCTSKACAKIDACVAAALGVGSS